MWPVLAIVLVPVLGALLAVCAAAALGRRRAPLAAAWTAIVTFFVVDLSTGPALAPFAGYQARGAAGRAPSTEPATRSPCWSPPPARC